jgi:hypothetical protein
MRYMMLIYTKEKESGLTRGQAQQLSAAHSALMQETTFFWRPSRSAPPQLQPPSGCITAKL